MTKIRCGAWEAFTRVADYITTHIEEVKQNEDSLDYISKYEKCIKGYFPDEVVEEIRYSLDTYLDDIKEENKEGGLD